MKLRNSVIVVAAVAMAAMIQPAQAILSSGTLADLKATGQSIGIDDKIFSGFDYQANGLAGFDASQITVTASIGPGGVDYLSFTGNTLQLSGFVNVITSGDLLLKYHVTATAGAISMIDQLYNGGAQNGSILVTETATSPGAPTATSQLSKGFVNDPSDPNVYPNGPINAIDIGEGDLLTVFPAQSTLDVTKDIVLTIFPTGGGVSLSLVQQSFHQVPEPTTVIAGALLLLPLGASTLRILRRNRIG